MERTPLLQNFFTYEGKYHEASHPATRDELNPLASARRAEFSCLLELMKPDFMMRRNWTVTLGDLLVDGSYYGLTSDNDFVPEVLEKEFGSREYVGIFGKYGTLCSRAFTNIFQNRTNAVEKISFVIANLKDAEVLRKKAGFVDSDEEYNAVKETRMMLEEIEKKRHDREWMVAFRSTISKFR